MQVKIKLCNEISFQEKIMAGAEEDTELYLGKKG